MGKVSIGFVYEAVYYTAGEDFAQAFGQVGSRVTGIRARQELTVWKVAVLPVRTSYLGTGTLAEGWTLTPHHQSVPWSQGLFKGDGSLARGVGGQVIHTVAGTGEYGYSGDGAAAIDAKLSSPQGCAVDQAGNLYFADIGNHRIRKLAVDGTITTVAGGDRPGFQGDGDMATQSLLRFPTSVAVDAAGNLYIADSGNNRVRKVGKDGVIATVAGTGVRGYNGDGIQAKEADLTYPQDVAVDDAGNLYIVQNQEHRIRKVDPSGIITTVAGTGQSGYNGDGIQAISARLNLPGYVVIDTDGNIIIADTFNHRIRRVGIDGVIATIAGTGSAGYDSDEVPAGLARLNHPFSIALDENGNLYIADFENARIRKVGTDGIISTVAGIGRGGYGGDGDFAVAGELNGPRGIALDSDGNIYISDSINSRIRRVSPETQFDMLSGYPGHRVYATDGVAHVMGLEGEHRLSLDFVTGTPVQSFDYDESGQLTTVTDKDGNTTIIERGPDGVPTAIVSPDGLVTSLGIDGSRHLREVVYPDGSGYRFAYTADGRMTDVWDPNGNHFTHGFDDDGALTEVTDPEGGRWSYGHGVDAAGTIHTQEETGEGNVTSFRERTDFGGTYSRLTTSPFGAETAHTRAGDGRSVSEDTACGTRVELAYGLDPHYWHTVLQGTTTVLPSGLDRTVSVDRTYQDTDADGVPDRVTETVRVNGMPWTTVNDARSGTVTSTSPQGRTATAVYDPASLRALQLSVPGLLPVSYGYDARGRVETVTVGSRTTSLAYDANGYPAAAVTPDGRTIDYRFDVMGRLREEARPDGAVLQYDYDPNGNLTVLTTPRLHVHRFAYTANDQRRSYLAPLSGSYVYSYDTERNLQTVRSPSGRLLTNRYANGLLQSTQTPEGTVTYSHDCGGRISGAALGAESVSLTFDGPLLTSDTRHGTLSQTLSYGYDHDFRLTSLHYAGETETFGYDLDGLLVSAGELSVHRSAQNGLPEAVTGGAAELTRAFNGYGELDETAYVVAGRPVFQWQVGERDPAGRITRKVETIGGGTTVWEYLYDEAGRLTEVTKDAVPVETYSHDLNGNRTLEANTLRGIEARGYAYDAEDRVVTAGAEVYAFDEDGFLERKTTEAGTTIYTYSSRGELLRVDLPDGRVLTYDHDPFGRRVAKRVNGQIVEKYLWAGANRGLLAVYDGSDGLIARFRYADDRVPVTVTVAGQTYLLAADQLGTVRAVADTQGNVVKRIDYDTFGNVLYDSNPTFPLPLGFAGGLHDRDAGLVRFGARDYDPALGRWVAKDPIDFAGGDVVLYGYVAGDPVNFTDPDGLWVQYAASAVVGAASGALMVSLTTPNAPFSVYLAAAGLGAVSGLGAVHLGPGIFLQSMIGAGVGTAGYSATTILSGQKPNAAGICFAATGGAIGGAFSGLQSQNLAISLASTWISGVRGAAFGWLGHNLQQQVSAHPRSATIIP
ncbi:MAG: RHS repeat-associated core domain-containing protein [Deferrisomatales bacterium]|nr:RHS repeat-associated core domain-containing protein [Deferrisomatales bacterium]